MCSCFYYELKYKVNQITVTLFVMEHDSKSQRIYNGPSFFFQSIFVWVHYFVGSNIELVGEDSSKAHDNNGTYIYTGLYYVRCQTTIL